MHWHGKMWFGGMQWLGLGNWEGNGLGGKRQEIGGIVFSKIKKKKKKGRRQGYDK